MSVLFIKHIDIEGPGTVADFLQSRDILYRTVDVSLGDLTPLADMEDIRAVIILGGPMNVYEEDKYSFLKAEDLFIKKALREGIPMLGLCLGAQLIAKATGAKVVKAANKEIGWFRVSLTDNASTDPLFHNLNGEMDVFQWHGDTFTIPDNGVHLAASRLCANQAFRYGQNAYGLQFHLEVTAPMVRSWLDAYADEIATMENVDRNKILMQAESCAAVYNNQADRFYENFFKIAGIE